MITLFNLASVFGMLYLATYTHCHPKPLKFQLTEHDYVDHLSRTILYLYSVILLCYISSSFFRGEYTGE